MATARRPKRKTKTNGKIKKTGWYFRDGRGSWHWIDTRPRGKSITMPLPGKSIARHLMITDIMTAKQYIQEHVGR